MIYDAQCHVGDIKDSLSDKARCAADRSSAAEIRKWSNADYYSPHRIIDSSRLGGAFKAIRASPTRDARRPR